MTAQEVRIRTHAWCVGRAENAAALNSKDDHRSTDTVNTHTHTITTAQETRTRTNALTTMRTQLCAYMLNTLSPEINTVFYSYLYLVCEFVYVLYTVSHAVHGHGRMDHGILILVNTAVWVISASSYSVRVLVFWFWASG